ncbi:MAG: DUF4097 family beta strand repeat-containing protein [Calditrichaceae bacterium]
MNNDKIYFIIFIFCMLAGSAGFGRSISKDFHESFRVKSGDKLYLNHGDGNVNISSWDKNIVDIEVHFSADIFSLGSDDYDFDIEFEQRDNEITVKEKSGTLHHIGVRGFSIDRYEYLIHAPAYLILDLNGNDGDVNIRDMNADINSRLSDGDIEFTNISADIIALDMEDGSLDMNKISGDLNITLDDGDATITEYTGKLCRIDIEDGRLEINHASGNFDVSSDDGTMNMQHLTADKINASSGDGDIYIDLIRSDKSDIDISTDDGKVIIDLNAAISAKIEVKTDDGKIEADFSNPEYERKKDSYYYCKINGGDGRIEINTRDGDIILREVK